MSVDCAACHAPGDANLCRSCTAKLEQTIADLTALAADLQAVATRQAGGPLGLGDPSRSCERGAGVDAPWQPPGARADGALGDAPWDFAPGAADQLWAAANTIAGWVRHLVDRHGYDIPAATRGRWTVVRGGLAVHRNRMRWRELRVWTPTPEQPIDLLVQWLLTHVTQLRADPDAGQAFDELTGLHADMTRATLGAPPADAFYGLCDKPDVRVELTDEGALRPVVGRCGVKLFGVEDARIIECHACGATYTRAERNESMLAELADTLGTVRQVASTLTMLGRPVTVGQIDGWLRRRLITARGASPKMVRVGDVLKQRAAIAGRGSQRARKAA